jgi:hypothetical protein
MSLSTVMPGSPPLSLTLHSISLSLTCAMSTLSCLYIYSNVDMCILQKRNQDDAASDQDDNDDDGLTETERRFRELQQKKVCGQ